ncbi:hypothetical protein LOTGIDRAFT_165494 [Lottia gigantea]|uniref:Uncharacterized protein n=1 Tax=Lottia gigantea TaxID=225164 RepID=V3ZWD9_LOTGI|nr:hypothetical protein LOTGIDRAFT_165494 [Lottia gigantea]ESO88707.1 hypothetical protein LOTGIDRAFT_165494 [Lottia gigantea]
MTYQLRLGDRKYSRRFHTNSVYLNVDFTQNWHHVLPAEVPQQLDITFNQIIRDIGNYLSCDPDDQVRFGVSHPGLKSPAWIPFNKWSGIRAQDILNPVARILQSNEQFRLDERMTLHVCHVSVPKGDGQGKYLLKRESLSLEDYLKRKRALVVVKNKDNLCFQRAIVIAKHYANKNDTPEWEAERNKLVRISGPYSWQTKCTKRLIEQVDGRAEACQGQETWELYQRTLGQQGYQLFVYSRLLFGKLLYKGKVSGTPKNFISTITTTIMTSLLQCLPFQRKIIIATCVEKVMSISRHTRFSVCNGCRRPGKDCPTDTPRSCLECHRTFFSEECFKAHKTGTTLNAITTCNKWKQCTKCCKE